jgi:hypothetical protein
MTKIDLTDSLEKIPVKIFPSPKDGSAYVASIIAQLIKDKNAEGKKAVIGLATGSSPKTLYAELVRMHKLEGLSFKNVITGYHFTPMSKLIFTNRMFEICTSLFFLARWVYLPYYQTNNIFTLVEIIPLFVVAGYYLAFFFVISHNFDGVEMFDKSNSSCNQSFLYKQVSTSSNVGGSLLCFLNGGLNYQIEHHLFPRISHVHYPKIAPYVKDFCDKKKIPYRHFPDIQSNVMACVKHLYEMGHGKSKF